MEALTWSVKHQEDRPLLLLQQLPEVLKNKSEGWGGGVISFIMKKQKINIAQKVICGRKRTIMWTEA